MRGGYIKHIILIFSLLILSLFLMEDVDAQEARHFNLSGRIVNSSYANATGANISVYVVTMDNLGGRTKTWNGTTITNHSGEFLLIGINNSQNVELLFEIKLINNVTFNVSEVGPLLPAFPSFMVQSFMNNQTFFTQPAVTFRLNGTNASGQKQDFNYIIMDTILGSEIDSSFTILRNGTIDVVAPRDRNYTVIFMRDFELAGNSAIPPFGRKYTNTSLYDNVTYDRVIPVKVNLSYITRNITGNINITAGHNSSKVNVTSIRLNFYLDGLIPPAKTDASGATINLTDNGDKIANFSTMVAGSSEGIQYLVEVYGHNATGNGPIGPNDEFYMGIGNTTVVDTANSNVNIQLFRLAGAYDNSTGDDNRILNTSRTTVLFVNGATSGQEVGNLHVDLIVNTPSGLQLRYMKDDINGSLFRHAFMNNSNVTVKVYSSQFAPLEKKLNLSNNLNNISLSFFGADHIKDGSGANTTRGNFTSDTGNLQMYLMKNSAECNVQEPSVINCAISSGFDQDFNPFKAMLGGKINMYMKLGDSRLHFIGLDLLSSGPPGGSMSDSQTTDGGSLDSIWKFGTIAPPIYDQVYIGISYNASKMNESNMPNITLDYLYDNEWELVWNISQNPVANNTPSDYNDYNKSWFNRTAGGVRCTNSTSSMCFMNTTNNTIWLTIPHFSNFGANIRGEAPGSSSSSSTGSSSSSGSSSNLLGNDKNKDDEIQESPEEKTKVERGEIRDVGELSISGERLLMAKDSRLSFDLQGSSYNLGVLTIGEDSVTLDLNGEQRTLKAGDVWETDIDGDGINDISVKFNNVEEGYAYLIIKQLIKTQDATKDTILEPLEKGVGVWWLVMLLLVLTIIVFYFVSQKINAKQSRWGSKKIKGKTKDL